MFGATQTVTEMVMPTGCPGAQRGKGKGEARDGERGAGVEVDGRGAGCGGDIVRC